MKLVDYTDDIGRKFKVSVPDDATTYEARFGSPVGPPDLTPLGLPQATMLRLHNHLFELGLITAKDVKARRMDVMSAWQAAMAVDCDTIVNIYGEAEQPLTIISEHHPSQITGSGNGTAQRAALSRGRRM